MVDQDNIAAAVLAWYETQWNKPTLTGKKQQVNADLSLNTGDYPWARESGDDIMRSYFRQFNVKQDAFDLFNYWPPEQGFLPNFLLPKSKRISPRTPEPLTLAMLIASAQVGRWLYR
ncbi:DUF1493 family protein [Klebsiella sp. 141153]|uniref:DUF1493 family protein n=1 Tax=Klebsiella sp. 141153 TaxID=3020033 RepID=UPI002927845A|nr:DUF1493 family protein [Klebsiella sp. 141153]MDU9355517.1 DUF1493 family protein [Klebsiella sp. 141153]